MKDIHQARVLSVVIQSGRLGFAVFVVPDRLLDRGMARFDSREKARRWFNRSLRTFRPSMVVLNRRGYRDKQSGRTASLTMTMMRRQARQASVPTAVVSGRGSRAFWRGHGRRNKYAVAALAAKQFPELASKVPTGRKCYQREPWLMISFDAVALGVFYLAQQTHTSVEFFRRTSR